MSMTLCHSVEVNNGHFVASSPDEKAILETCSWAGFKFEGNAILTRHRIKLKSCETRLDTGEQPDGTATINAKGQSHTYKKMAELQFDSFRKCMSVIVRPKYNSGVSNHNNEDEGEEEDLIYVFVKGAESSVLPICVGGPVEETKMIVDHFANEGLRTLVYAYKTISREEFNRFSEKLDVARQSIVNR